MNARPRDAAETNSGSMPPGRVELQAGLCATPHADGKPLARPRAVLAAWHTPATRLAGHVIVEQLEVS